LSEWRLFEEGTVPDWTRPEWYAGRDRAPHLEQELHRPRLMEAAAQVAAVAEVHFAKTLVDLGAGDGGLLQLLQREAPALECWGYDLQQSNVDGAAGRGVDVRLGDVVAGVEYFGEAPDGTVQTLPVQWGDVAVATECLEHLLEPHQFVRTVAEHCRVLVASSPHTERPGAAYGFHTFAWDVAGYRALLEQGGFRVVRHKTVGMFQVIAGVRA
jgi:2-polyprenyl-3-methyl-5-hydroxy-6-metoxy-1,4-benzoquinol methylase